MTRIRQVTRPSMPVAAARLVGVGSVIACLVVVVGHTLRGWPFGATEAVAVLSNSAVAISYAGVGWLIVERRGSKSVGLILASVGAFFAAGGAADLYLQPIFVDGTMPPGADLAALYMTAAQYPIMLGLATAMVLFPDGRRSRVWQLIIVAGLVGALLGVAGHALGASTFAPVFPSIDSPFAIPAFPKRRLVAIADTASQAMLVAAVIALLVLWRRGDRILRAQTTWVIAATALIGLVQMAERLTAGRWDWFTWWLGIVASLAVCLVPVAMGIAITRYRLYDIDRLVSRSITYGAVTVLLFAVYAAVNLGLQGVLSGLTGAEPVAVTASTLAAALLFSPVRAKVQRIVDRRFHRARYDADRTVGAFADRLRDELDLSTLTADLRHTAGAAVAPATTSIWLRGGNAR